MRHVHFRRLLGLFAVAMMLAFVAGEVVAAPRVNMGSRGTKTFSAPPPTATAPNAARPIERTMTQPAQPGAAGGAAAVRPAAPAPTGGFFNRPGLLGGLAAGFLGAGLFGMLFGHGLMGGLGGIASFLGLILQVGLVVMVGYFLWHWWQRRSQPAFAAAPNLRSVDMGRDQRPAMGLGMGSSGSGTGLGAGLGSSAAPPLAPEAGGDEIGTTPADFDAFERLLGETWTAYGAEDLAALRTRVTPEMLSYFSEELAANASRGEVNRISDIKLLQGDLAEAWRERDTDYATVAMRYSSHDQIAERAGGRVIKDGPDEATELWTFRRAQGGAWILSAIQQA
jgi:predicted lipid-binding transport protein (Tim44 family)